jgi:hypothetical protein
MSSWLTRPRRSPRLLRVILALISIVVPLKSIAMGGEEILLWIRFDLSNQYYVEQWGIARAKVLLLMGIIGMLPAGWVLFRRQASGRWLSLSLLVSFFLMMYPAYLTFDGLYSGFFAGEYAEKKVRYDLRFFVGGEMKQAAEQGKPWHCTPGPTTTLSPYSRAGERLFYQRVCVTADHPPASLLASSAPGTIYIATGPDEQVVWLMATGLSRSASDTVMWVRHPSGKPLVLTRDRSFHDDWPR